MKAKSDIALRDSLIRNSKSGDDPFPSFAHPTETVALTLFGRAARKWMCHYIFDDTRCGFRFNAGAVADPQLARALAIFDRAGELASERSEAAVREFDSLRCVPYAISSAAASVFGRNPDGEWHQHIFWPYLNAFSDYNIGRVTDKMLLDFLDEHPGRFVVT